MQFHSAKLNSDLSLARQLLALKSSLDLNTAYGNTSLARKRCKDSRIDVISLQCSVDQWSVLTGLYGRLYNVLHRVKPGAWYAQTCIRTGWLVRFFTYSRMSLYSWINFYSATENAKHEMKLFHTFRLSVTFSYDPIDFLSRFQGCPHNKSDSELWIPHTPYHTPYPFSV